jgi:hypothetical protein
VQIREDQRVVDRRRHDLDCRQIVLRGDELGNLWRAEVTCK